jgi:two-component system KDP operon response regulator KdpE
MKRVLVVDDDVRIRRLIKVNLEKRGHTVTEAANGSVAISLMQREFPDLILLDLVMPEMDGIEVCRWVRQRQDTPIIVLSAHNQEELKVQALDLGADDYMTKPFGQEELLARMRAVLRRTNDTLDQQEASKVEISGMTIDLSARRVFVEGSDIRLTKTEFALIAELARNLDNILSHDELLARVWGPEYRGSSHYLHVYLGRVRKKIGEQHNAALETVPGLGYVLHSSVNASS